MFGRILIYRGQVDGETVTVIREEGQHHQGPHDDLAELFPGASTITPERGDFRHADVDMMDLSDLDDLAPIDPADDYAAPRFTAEFHVAQDAQGAGVLIPVGTTRNAREAEDLAHELAGRFCNLTGERVALEV